MVMPGLRGEFDLVYVDQRGTGASGYMDCPDQTNEGLRRCARDFADRDLNHYMTVDAADDIEWVRRRLGYETIMIRGGSYGTRLGLEFARRYPERIAAMVLDGAIPADDDFFTAVVQKADRGIEQLIADCATDSRCREMAPTLEDDLQSLLRQSMTDPRQIYVDGVPDIEEEWVFRAALQSFVEDWYWRFRMPRAIDECARGDCSRWDGMLSELFAVTITSETTGGSLHIPSDRPLLAQSSYVAIGLYVTVICGEYVPNIESFDRLLDLEAEQVYGDSSDTQEIVDICSSWQVDPIPAELRAPFSSDVPTLFMSGAIDFVTPPEAAAEVAETFSNGHHVIIPDATHSTMITPCGSQIITDFFYAGGDFSQVDTSCVETYGLPFE
jgi:pimeloyl-ACP methyl ester carboxylesterase